MNESTKNRSEKRHWIVFLVVVSLLAGGVWWIVHPQQNKNSKNQQNDASSPPSMSMRGGSKNKNMAVPVRTETVTQRNVPILLSALGTITSQNTVTVRPRVEGLLQKVMFQEGQQVKAGQMLALLDSKPFEVAVSQAKAQLAKDKALLENARQDAARYKELLAKDSVSKQVADTQFAQVKQYEATVAADQAAVDNALINLSYCKITSPITGRIGLRTADPGNMIRTSDTNGLASIVQMSPITALFNIPEDQLVQVRQAMTQKSALMVTALNKTGNQVLEEGQLLTLDNQIDSTTGTIRAKAVFKNQKELLFPNQFVNIQLKVGVQLNAVVVPAPAIEQGQNGAYVYVATPDHKVKLVTVQTGTTYEGMTVIHQGLEVGQAVVVDGSGKLKDGSSIKVVGQ